MQTIVIKFELVPSDEAPQNHFRRSLAIFVGIFACHGAYAFLGRTGTTLTVKLVLGLVAYSLVTNMIYPFWRIRMIRR